MVVHGELLTGAKQGTVYQPAAVCNIGRPVGSRGLVAGLEAAQNICYLTQFLLAGLRFIRNAWKVDLRVVAVPLILDIVCDEIHGFLLVYDNAGRTRSNCKALFSSGNSGFNRFFVINHAVIIHKFGQFIPVKAVFQRKVQAVTGDILAFLVSLNEVSPVAIAHGLSGNIRILPL